MRKKPPRQAPTTTVFETYRDIGSYDVRNLTQEQPSCFNGDVRVRRYRVTIERIDEPVEVITARLQTLWETCDNMHYWESLKAAAARLGYALKGSAGAKRKDKR